MIINLYGQIASDASIAADPTLKNAFSSSTIKAALQRMPANDKELYINLNSPGGEVLEGFAIYDILRQSGKNVHTNIEGGAHSAAMLVALAAPKENRTANPNAVALLHPVQTSYDGDAVGMAQDLVDTLEFEQAMVNIYSERTGMATKDVEKLLYDQKTHLAPELQQLGFVNSINKSKTNKMGTKTSIAELLAKASNFMGKTAKMLSEKKNFDYQDADGNLLFSTDSETDDLAVGSVVTLADGVQPGDLTLGDGRVVSVDDGGNVTAITTPAANDGDDVEALKAQIADLKSQLTAGNSLVEELRNQIQSNYVPPRAPTNLKKPADPKAPTAAEIKAAMVAARTKNIKK